MLISFSNLGVARAASQRSVCTNVDSWELFVDQNYHTLLTNEKVCLLCFVFFGGPGGLAASVLGADRAEPESQMQRLYQRDAN